MRPGLLARLLAAVVSPAALLCSPLNALAQDTSWIDVERPGEWATAAPRPLRLPEGRSLFVSGSAYDPVGIEAVLVNGLQAAVRTVSKGRVHFEGYTALSAGASELQITVERRNRPPLRRAFPVQLLPPAGLLLDPVRGWPSGGEFRGQRWAVLIGVSAYEDTTIRPLAFADSDALAMRDFLRSPAAGLGGIPADHMKVLVDRAATAANVRYALFDFLEHVQPEDAVLIFIAAHGMQDAAHQQDTYVYTYDTRTSRQRSTALAVSEIARAVNLLNVKERIVLVDACHSGGLMLAGLRDMPANAINRDFLERMTVSSGGLSVFTASTVSEPAREDSALRHGAFTAYLLQALAGAADRDRSTGNGDGIVTMGEAITWVTRQVQERTGRAQNPAVGNYTFDRDWPLAITTLGGRARAGADLLAAGVAPPGVVRAVRLFPSREDVPDGASRAYGTAFDSASLSRLRLELTLEHGAPRDTLRVPLACEFTMADGRTFPLNWDLVFYPGLARTEQVSPGFGWKETGKWHAGSYSVRCTAGGTRLVDLSFAVRPAATMIPSLSARVTGLRFFPSGDTLPDVQHREYATRFDAGSISRIGAEISLAYPRAGTARTAPVVCAISGPQPGTISWMLRVQPGWTSSTHAAVGPGSTAGAYWIAGQYAMACSVDGIAAARGSFEVAPRHDFTALAADVRGISFFEERDSVATASAVHHSVSFDSSRARYIYTQLDLRHGAAGRQVSEPFTCTYATQSAVIGTVNGTISVQPTWANTRSWLGWGAEQPGTWTPGPYHVECTAAGRVIARGDFDVVASASVPPLSARVTALQFFEAGDTAPPPERRSYTQVFDSASTRYVYYQLDLSQPTPGLVAEPLFPPSVSVLCRYFWPDGTEMGPANLTITLPRSSASSSWTNGRGWSNHPAWRLGTYRVSCSADGRPIATGRFTIRSH